ncbi:hypothetical protein PZY29_11950 [Enterococcus casseliflavus]|nr:hypothetical protein [Enterococcus casseliflavus]WEI91436.1 hypothetical protein PZY29_11950 [Enterococcus casseliflavus]
MYFNINKNQDNILTRPKQIVSVMLFSVWVIGWLSYTIIDQQKQIVKLEQQLQYEQMKYKIIINDPLVRAAMESGG